MSARPPLPKSQATLLSKFPPSVSQADELLTALVSQGGDFEAACRAVSGWSDAMLELVAEVARGPMSEAPVEEVWHWLAGAERLARGLSFAEHFSVQGLVARLEAAHTVELERWQAALRQLRAAQRESSWNARYLRVVEEPLLRLGSEPPQRLPQLVGTVMRSLRRIHSSSQLREPRLVALLQKILKALVARAADSLPPPFQVAAGNVLAEEAESFRDAFRGFLENYFIDEAASGASSSSASPRRELRSASRERPSTPKVQRQDSGWWRATVRHSRELAQSCAKLCGALAGLNQGVARLRGALPQLLAADPALLRDAQGFLELHSGPRAGLSTAELLEPKRRLEAEAQLAEVGERLQALLTRCEQAGVSLEALPESGGASLCPPGPPAEVLTLDAEPGRPALQESIDCLQEELQEMSSELDHFGKMLSSEVRFAPPRREEAAAEEVARRSSWFHAPPPVVPKEVPLIEVQHRITQRVIKRCPSRPRTAQPAMVVTAPQARPQTSAGQVSLEGHTPRGSDEVPPVPEESDLLAEEDPKLQEENDNEEPFGMQCGWKVS